MTKPLDALLDHLAGYLGRPDNTCFSLPREAYLSMELYEREVRAIFEKSWLCVGREEYAPKPGDYYCIDVMGEPVIIVRGIDGKLRALNAVCRHRSMLVVQDRGNAQRFVCPYHAWTYDTAGHLIGAPHMEGSEVFDRKTCSLPEYRLDSWMGFLFVNLDDDAAPLQPVMASMDRAVANYRVGEQTEIFHYETEWNGNWKLAAENSMEYYHHIALHAGTVGVQMPAKGTYIPAVPATDKSFTHERCRMGEKYIGGADHPMNPRGDLSGLTKEELTTGYMVYVFPAFTMAMRPGTNNWLSFRPDGPEKTKVLGGYLMWNDIAEEDPELGRQRRELIAKVNEEDSLATTELAKAMRSRKAARGPLSHFEGTIAQFYKYLARTLTTDRTPATLMSDDGSGNSQGVKNMAQTAMNDPSKATAAPADGTVYLEPTSVDWQPDGDKYWIKPLHNDPATGQRICLAKLDAGAWFPLHAHEEIEHIYVLSGSFYDQDRTLKAGDYACRAPGAMHSAGSKEGAVMLLVYNRP